MDAQEAGGLTADGLAGAARCAAFIVALGLGTVGCGGGTKDRASDAPPPAPIRVIDYFVSPKGDDDDSGSREHPWKTIRHAATQVGPGSTVHVARGRYAGRLVLRVDGRPGGRIRFLSSRRWGARITATSSGSLGIVSIPGDYVDFEGFDVSGRGGDGTAGIIVPGSHNRVLSNDVHDVRVACTGGPNGGGGIVAGGGTPNYRNHDIAVIGNLVHDVVGTPSRECTGVQGIYASVANVRIVNNVSYRNGDNCITSWHAATRLRIVNNTVADCPVGITVGSGGPGATEGGNRDTTVANNIVLRCGRGIAETSDGEHRVGPGNRYLNNLVFRCGARGMNVGGVAPRGGRPAVGATLTLDPRLRSRASHYQPRPSSPVIDAGVNTGAPATDFAGVRRPQGRQVDIGAFEWSRPAG
jgi:hypothetical protein